MYNLKEFLNDSDFRLMFFIYLKKSNVNIDSISNKKIVDLFCEFYSVVFDIYTKENKK